MLRSPFPCHSLRTLGLTCALVGLGAGPARAQSDAGVPQLQLTGEEPTGIYFDRDTLTPQTPILFSVRLQNPTPDAHEFELGWKITDSSGKTVWARRGRFSLDGGGTIARRELFDPPSRGGFLLQVDASYSRRGPDAHARVSLPFAVTLAPLPTSVQGARPRSFFVLDAPPDLDATGLNFYSRLGARVLRSPLVANPTNPDWAAVGTQLGERLKRNLSTIALLDVGEDGSRASVFWSRQVPSTLARYNALSMWELAGDVDASDLDAWSQLARARRPDLVLLSPLPALPSGVALGEARLKSGALDGATFRWPLARTQSVHPAALRRLWLSRALAAREAGLSSFHLRRTLGAGEAGELTADYLSAIMAGASSMSEALAPPSGDPSGAQTMARAAAFTMMSRTLEDAAFREQLFPKSPNLEGALFRVPRGSVAVLYAPLQGCKMTLRVAPAQALDAFGNTLAASKNGQIQVRLGEQPVYIASSVGTEVLSYALRTAKVSGLDSLAVQPLPLSRVPGTNGPGSAAVRVRVQNIGLASVSTQLQLKAPKGWQLARDRYDVSLAPGEAKTFEFRAPQAPFDAKKALGFRLGARGDAGGTWNWDAQVASATSVAPDSVPTVDGRLDDWKDASWLTCAPNAQGVGAQVAFKWDAKNLYVAAKVREGALTARNPEATSYEFWRGFDAVQLAFGLSSGANASPSTPPFRDSDFGFLLSPWLQIDAGNYQGRLLSLWSPTKPYNTTSDRVRYGGAVAGGACAVSRDEGSQTTIYEARLPLSALPGVNPKALAQKDGAVRFGFLVHNAEGAPLDWGAQSGNFPWWDNTSTFLPEGRLTSSLRSTLGFTLTGTLATPSASVPATVTSPRHAPVPAPAPPRRKPPRVPSLPPAPVPGPSVLPPLPPPATEAPSPAQPTTPAPPSLPLAPSLPPAAVPNLPAPATSTSESAPLTPFVVPPADQTPPRERVGAS